MLQQQSPDVHRSNPLWVLTTVEANQPHDTTPTSTPTTARTVTLRKVGDLYAPACIIFLLMHNMDSEEADQQKLLHSLLYKVF